MGFCPAQPPKPFPGPGAAPLWRPALPGHQARAASPPVAGFLPKLLVLLSSHAPHPFAPRVTGWSGTAGRATPLDSGTEHGIRGPSKWVSGAAAPHKHQARVADPSEVGLDPPKTSVILTTPPALQYNPTSPMRRAPSPPPSDRAGLCSQPLRGLVTFLPASPCAGRPSRPQAPRLEAAFTPRTPRRPHTFPDLQLRLLSLKEGRRGGVASKWEADSAAALFQKPVCVKQAAAARNLPRLPVEERTRACGWPPPPGGGAGHYKPRPQTRTPQELLAS